MNYMKEVATLLGVQLGEEFYIEGIGGQPAKKFWIDEDGLKSEHLNSHYPETFSSLIMGNCKIVKIPYRPKFGQRYYACGITDGRVCSYLWDDDFIDCINLYLGNVYRTRQEVEQAQPKFFKQIGYQQKITSSILRRSYIRRTL